MTLDGFPGDLDYDEVRLDELVAWARPLYTLIIEPTQKARVKDLDSSSEEE